jgi:epsin
MNELAQLTYNQSVASLCSAFPLLWLIHSHRRNDFVEIMEMLDKRLNDKGKNWRHVFKASLYCAEALRRNTNDPMTDAFRTGFDSVGLSPSCRIRKCGHLLQGQHLHHQVRGYAMCTPCSILTESLSRTLKEFVYVDEEMKDLGTNVRQKAKDITNLLQDDDRLRRERRSYVTRRSRYISHRRGLTGAVLSDRRGAMRDRMLGTIAESGLQGENDYGDRGDDEYARRREPAPP